MDSPVHIADLAFALLRQRFPPLSQISLPDCPSMRPT